MIEVSVIVPVYNVEKYLARCLDSLINQSFADYEIICVNDCSPDNSQAVLDDYYSKYTEKIVLHKNQQNMGLGATRDVGISLARGEYIMFVDSDDYVKDDWIEVYINEIKRDDFDVVLGGYIRYDGKIFSVKKPASGKYAMCLYTSACMRMYKKEFIVANDISFCQLRRSEDIYWMVMILTHNPTMSVLDYAGYYYCENSSSITQKVNYKMNLQNDFKVLFDSIYKDVNLDMLSQLQRDMIEYVFLSNTIVWLMLHNRGCGIKLMKERYNYYFKLLENYFPDYRKNPMIGFTKVKEEQLKIRIAVAVTIYLKRIRLDWLIFYMIAVI